MIRKMLRLFLWGTDVEVTYCTVISEPIRFRVQFDSLEELKAAVTIITLYNLSSLYKVIVREMADRYRVISFSLDGDVITHSPLRFEGFVVNKTAEHLGFLEEKLRRSYESV